MEKSVLLRIWSRIVDELAFHQDLAPDEFRGQVVNPISGSVYSQNTGCAALIFTAEHIRSREMEWLSRAQAALESLRGMDFYSGLDEPRWDRWGWHYNKGSLFTTGILLDVLWKTFDLLDLEDNKEGLLHLLHYLETCRIRPGLFAHDSVKPGEKHSAIQNTTAIVLYLMEVAAAKIETSQSTFLNERDLILRFLRKGQRQDGFWPYVYPGAMQQIIFRLPFTRSLVRRFPVIQRCHPKGDDASVFFGDAVHHCLVLYYLVKSIVLRRSANVYTQAIASGWAWIRKHLVKNEDDSLRFDFSWEPIPRRFRYCNFRDTSTYFLILAMLSPLAHLGIVDKRDYHNISLGLLTHIESCLLESKGIYPSIKPYEGSQEITRKILPRVGEASAWKGALLAEFILKQSEVEG